MREHVIHEPEHEPAIRRTIRETTHPSVRAAGAVLWRPGPGGAEVGLVHRPKYDDWTFPKGKLKSGEHILQAAVREVAEETGITPRLGRRLPATRYLKNGKVKQVEYWAATRADDDDRFEANDEVDRLRWVSIPEAAELLSYDRDVHLLGEFSATPALTVPLIVLRHLPAGEKRDWKGPDSLRPLDSRGHAQASELAGLLAAYHGVDDEPLRLVSSLSARCVETLVPYALAARTSVSAEFPFTIEGSSAKSDLGAARARLGELLTDGRPTVLCTHGELVSGLVTALCERYDHRFPADPSLPKGGFWVAHLGPDAAGRIAMTALERHTTDVPSDDSTG